MAHMVSRFEAIGIAVSILCMAGALFLLNRELVTETAPAALSTSQEASVVVVGDGENRQTEAATALADAANPTTGTLERLVVNDVTIGSGKSAQAGDTVTVHYIGRLQNGQEFDNSYNRGEPFTFTLGEGQVIAGWEEGVKGMSVGGERILVVPPELAYGSRGAGPIPGNATLIFAVELLSVK